MHDCIIAEQAQKCARCGEVEQDVDEACQYIFESTIELTVVAKAKHLGETIFKLKDTNLMLNSLVQPTTSSEQAT